MLFQLEIPEFTTHAHTEMAWNTEKIDIDERMKMNDNIKQATTKLIIYRSLSFCYLFFLLDPSSTN